MISLKWNSNCWCACRVAGRQQQRCQFSRGSNRRQDDVGNRSYCEKVCHSWVLHYSFLSFKVMSREVGWRTEYMMDPSLYCLTKGAACRIIHLCAKTIPAVSALSVWLLGQGQYHPFCTMLQVCPWHFYVALKASTGLKRLYWNCTVLWILRVCVFHSQTHICQFINSVKSK